MKAVKVFSCLVLTCLFTSVNAQLRVLSDGRVQAGTLTDVDGLVNMVMRVQVQKYHLVILADLKDNR